jgi:DNA-directed RNA polymerase subunit RPC12/RpoP
MLVVSYQYLIREGGDKVLVMHDFRCVNCGKISEAFVVFDLPAILCPDCGSRALKTFEQFGCRKHFVFPEGPWHGLEELDGHPVEVRSRRQLREHLKRTTKDKYTEHYAVYDDGYAGY